MTVHPRSPPAFALDSRLSIGGERCTVRFAGLLPDTTPADAPWLGVEWDDRDRGKHDGTHDGVRYFQCSGTKAGSFVRPTSNKIQRPQPFLRVLLDRYAGVPSPTSRSVALPPPTALSSSSPPLDGQSYSSSAAPRTEEHVSLGSTAIQVVAPNLAKVRRRLGNVPALREVGADDALVGFLGEGEHGEMQAMGPWKTKHLNLSKSLLASWEDVDRIVAPLDLLEGLDLTSNRFSLPPPPPSQLPSLNRLTELNLTATFLSFTAILDLEPALPNLRSLTYSSNELRSFKLTAPPTGDLQAAPASRERREKWFPNLQELHLDWNELDDWSRLGFLGELTGLRYLSLSNNRLPSLPLPDPAAHSPLTFLPPKLETLRLAKNAVGDWSTVDLLNERLGALRVLWLGGNPITSVGAAPARVGDPVDEDEEDRRERRRVRDVRAGVIARVRGLAVLDGSEISAGERKAAELDYVLSQPAAFCAPEADSAAGPLAGKARWDELAARHGSAQESDQEGAAREVRKPSAAVLKDKLLNVSFVLPAPSDPSAVTLRFLPSTPLRTVLLKVSKHLDPSLAPAALLRSDGLQLVKGPDGDEAEALEGAKRTLHDLGVEEGETLRVLIA